MHHRRSAIFMTSLLASIALAGVTGCSSSPLSRKTSAQELSSTGPTILNPRTDPGTFEVTRELKPIQTPVVLAEVKDLTGNISEVRLHFERAPIDVPMTRIAGTTWRATLSAAQIRKLAISGKTMKYEATIHARNDQGRQGSSETVDIIVKAPKIDATG